MCREHMSSRFKIRYVEETPLSPSLATLAPLPPLTPLTLSPTHLPSSSLVSTSLLQYIMGKTRYVNTYTQVEVDQGITIKMASCCRISSSANSAVGGLFNNGNFNYQLVAFLPKGAAAGVRVSSFGQLQVQENNPAAKVR